MSVPQQRKRDWRMVTIGLCFVAVSVGICVETLQSMRTGQPIYTPTDRSLPADWWFWLPVGILGIFLGRAC
jgi:hypothetical protein